MRLCYCRFVCADDDLLSDVDDIDDCMPDALPDLQPPPPNTSALPSAFSTFVPSLLPPSLPSRAAVISTGTSALVSGALLPVLPSLSTSDGGRARETLPKRGGAAAAAAAAIAAAADAALAAAAATAPAAAAPAPAPVIFSGAPGSTGFAGAGAVVTAGDGDGRVGGAGHGRREIFPRPVWMREVAMPRTPHEISLAIECTSKARATENDWNQVLVKAATAYNVASATQFVGPGSRASQGSQELLAPTTCELLGAFWIGATKSNANEQLRQAALKWGLAGVAGGGRVAPGTATGGGPRTGVTGRARSGGVARSGGGASSGAGGRKRGMPSPDVPSAPRGTKPAGSAGPGETLVLTDAEIEGFGRNVLRVTLRSLEGVGVGSNVERPELERRLKDAVRAGKRRKTSGGR